MAPSIGTALLQILLVILIAAALFGVVWWRPVQLYGARLMLVGWAFSATVLGAIGSIRATSLLRRVGSPAAGELHATSLFALYAAFLAVVLAPPAIALVRRARKHPTSSLRSIALTSASWSLLGILLALVCLIVLDLSNVPFVPGTQTSAGLPN